ncbi:MAG TPA: LPS assembly lipoprotein LptE [Bryobacteraceae bacterium]|jgi:hypothetical protein|nr:LPS assembly lipoprotein LptE [Bryobacteraceae bacterium]
MRFWWGLSAAVVFLSSCGYHAGGKADLVPTGVQTIAIPAFTCYTTDYKAGDLLANSIGHEFTERTRFRVVSDLSTADAVLSGSINRIIRAPSLSDPTTGKISTVAIIMIMSINLTERASGKVLYSRPALTIKENYEIASDPHQIFDESGPAMQRLSQNLARDIVTSVVENF